jgi:hypothetical protein
MRPPLRPEELRRGKLGTEQNKGEVIAELKLGA